MEVIEGLRQSGFRVLNRAWRTNWEDGTGGTAATACRYATLLGWARETWPEGPLCLTGNSGGSAEISYALARYDQGAIVDLAVPTSGPPMSRIDLGCLGGEAWDRLCLAALPEDHCVEERQRICQFNAGNRALFDGGFEGTPCADRDPSARAALLEASVLSEDAALSYPGTRVHFLFGHQDCTVALPQGLLYYEAIQSEKAATWVDAPHAMQRDPEGVTAIIDTLTAECGAER